MKFYLQKLIFIILTFSYSFQIKCPNGQKNSKIVVASTSNTDNEVQIGKTESYGHSNYQLPKGVAMRTADYMDEHDTNIQAPDPGKKLETVDELPTIVNYYNGDMNLNLIKVNCNIYTNQFECLHQSECGWCPPKNTCMQGNAERPFEHCPEGFLFAGNLIKTINADVTTTNVRRMGAIITETILP